MYQIFTDGSSSKKRGTIGTSYIVFQDKIFIDSFSKGFIDKQARNGIAELLGVHYFLSLLYNSKFLNKNEEIIIYSDSQYVVNEFTIWFKNQMDKNFFGTKNKELIISILWFLYQLRKEEYIIKFKWIKGHQKGESFEIEGNNKADKLAVESHKEDIFINNLSNIEAIVEDLKIKLKNNKILNFLKSVY